MAINLQDINAAIQSAVEGSDPNTVPTQLLTDNPDIDVNTDAAPADGADTEPAADAPSDSAAVAPIASSAGQQQRVPTSVSHRNEVRPTRDDGQRMTIASTADIRGIPGGFELDGLAADRKLEGLATGHGPNAVIQQRVAPIKRSFPKACAASTDRRVSVQLLNYASGHSHLDGRSLVAAVGRRRCDARISAVFGEGFNRTRKTATLSAPPYEQQHMAQVHDRLGKIRPQGVRLGPDDPAVVAAKVSELDDTDDQHDDARTKDWAAPLIPPTDPPDTEGPDDEGFPDEYPELPDGSKVPFAPSSRPLPTEADLNRVFSKHAPDAKVPMKTRFPHGWTKTNIAAAIDLTTAAPESLARVGDKITFERVVNDVLVRVHIRVDRPVPIFWTAFPPNGTIAT